MAAIPAPTTIDSREEWTDADFDLPEGERLHASDHESDKLNDDDEDWDAEMGFGVTGGAQVKILVTGATAMPATSSSPGLINIRPPIVVDDEDDGDYSTVKINQLPKPLRHPPPDPMEDDLEEAFALPADLVRLSLAPLTLTHRPSKNFSEWGDKDQTSSSHSSDAYSSLGFTDTSPSSNSVSSASLPCSEAEDDEEQLEGLDIPEGLFEAGQAAKRLATILEMKKTAPPANNPVKRRTPDPEDDFEIGLIIDDDLDLCRNRLLANSHRVAKRRESMPARPAPISRPPYMSKSGRAKSPSTPPISSARHFQKLSLSPSPPLRPIRSQSFQPPTLAPTPKPGSLRAQKSHSGLKSSTPAPAPRKFPRKASMPSLMETIRPEASGSSSPLSSRPHYDKPTAASRAKSYSSSGRITMLDFVVPPTRPSTPSSNTAALRLTLPTATSRLKARPSLPSIFVESLQKPRPTSPLPASPMLSVNRIPPRMHVPHVLNRPKRPRTYGDGTELDGIDDLPTDRDKESRYRVQPKIHINRIPGGSYPKGADQGTLRRRGKREGSSGGSDQGISPVPLPSPLRQSVGGDLPKSQSGDSSTRRNKSGPQAKKKPMLIRHLGRSDAPKVVGEMKWNPKTLRWEGNEHVLRDFDTAIGTSTRPALITHLTGSPVGSPPGSFVLGARQVGNMLFDPKRMCWISTLPPEEDEPDVFANLADDEEDPKSWGGKDGTIRASRAVGSLDAITSTASISPTRAAPSPAPSHAISDSGSDRGSRPVLAVSIDEQFRKSCRQAEERHRAEMQGWHFKRIGSEPDRSSLYDIRALATRYRTDL